MSGNRHHGAADSCVVFILLEVSVVDVQLDVVKVDNRAGAYRRPAVAGVIEIVVAAQIRGELLVSDAIPEQFSMASTDMTI
jgi:hypothetical protein